MALVKNHQVVWPRVGGLVTGGQGFPELAHRALTLEEVDGSDEAREVGPWVDVDAAFASQLAKKIAVNDAEFEAEFVAHFLFPLHLNGRWAHDQDGAGAMAEDQFLRHEAGLDGFPEANVVGEGSRHAEALLAGLTSVQQHLRRFTSSDERLDAVQINQVMPGKY